jgi:sialate O-acetylesterase
VQISKWLRLSALGALSASLADADLILGTPFGDGMVMQRDKPVPVWGWTTPGDAIAVAFKGQHQETIAGADGKWHVTLAPLRADSTPAPLLILAGQKPITRREIRDVLVGEVWLCSGQSNMAMLLSEADNAKAEIESALYPALRWLRMPVSDAGLPRDRLAPAPDWAACSPQTAGGLSATAYYFGRELLRKLDVPVGLIVIATGATPIEKWVPREGLDLVPELAKWGEAARQADDQYRAARAAWDKTDPAATNRPPEPEHPYLAASSDRQGLGTLFNGAVAPVVGYGLRGMIWYQGESNRGQSSQAYFAFHKALVEGWRKAWGQGLLPFYYVQIGSLDSWRPDWQIPEIWEGQTFVLQLPNTGMAVIHDLCTDIRNIHPGNKEGVGRRLALWALAKDYGFKDLPYSGPLFKSSAVEGKRIRIRFDYTFGGLCARDGKTLDEFTLAGPDRLFLPAQAAIDGDSVVVWSDTVDQPVAVRFAWHESARPNLMNGAGLPAGPFRTNQPW